MQSHCPQITQKTKKKTKPKQQQQKNPHTQKRTNGQFSGGK